MSRFDLERIVPAPDPDLLCPICQSVLDLPKVTPCQHVFCVVCIERWLGTRNTCPTCRATVTKTDLKAVLPLLQNMINRLQITCLNQTSGCTGTIALENYHVHKDTCPYEKMRCRYARCNAELLRREKNWHEKTCSYREVRCKKRCGLMIAIREVIDHDCYAALRAKIVEQDEQLSSLRQEEQRLQEEVQRLQGQLDSANRDLAVMNDVYYGAEYSDDSWDPWRSDDSATGSQGDWPYSPSSDVDHDRRTPLDLSRTSGAPHTEPVSSSSADPGASTSSSTASHTEQPRAESGNVSTANRRWRAGSMLDMVQELQEQAEGVLSTLERLRIPTLNLSQLQPVTRNNSTSRPVTRNNFPAQTTSRPTVASPTRPVSPSQSHARPLYVSGVARRLPPSPDTSDDNTSAQSDASDSGVRDSTPQPRVINHVRNDSRDRSPNYRMEYTSTSGSGTPYNPWNSDYSHTPVYSPSQSVHDISSPYTPASRLTPSVHSVYSDGEAEGSFSATSEDRYSNRDRYDDRERYMGRRGTRNMYSDEDSRDRNSDWSSCDDHGRNHRGIRELYNSRGSRSRPRHYSRNRSRRMSWERSRRRSYSRSRSRARSSDRSSVRSRSQCSSQRERTRRSSRSRSRTRSSDRSSVRSRSERPSQSLREETRHSSRSSSRSRSRTRSSDRSSVRSRSECPSQSQGERIRRSSRSRSRTISSDRSSVRSRSGCPSQSQGEGTRRSNRSRSRTVSSDRFSVRSRSECPSQSQRDETRHSGHRHRSRFRIGMVRSQERPRENSPARSEPSVGHSRDSTPEGSPEHSSVVSSRSARSRSRVRSWSRERSRSTSGDSFRSTGSLSSSNASSRSGMRSIEIDRSRSPSNTNSMPCMPSRGRTSSSERSRDYSRSPCKSPPAKRTRRSWYSDYSERSEDEDSERSRSTRERSVDTAEERSPSNETDLDYEEDFEAGVDGCSTHSEKGQLRMADVDYHSDNGTDLDYNEEVDVSVSSSRSNADDRAIMLNVAVSPDQSHLPADHRNGNRPGDDCEGPANSLPSVFAAGNRRAEDSDGSTELDYEEDPELSSAHASPLCGHHGAAEVLDAQQGAGSDAEAGHSSDTLTEQENTDSDEDVTICDEEVGDHVEDNNSIASNDSVGSRSRDNDGTDLDYDYDSVSEAGSHNVDVNLIPVVLDHPELMSGSDRSVSSRTDSEESEDSTAGPGYYDHEGDSDQEHDDECPSDGSESSSSST